MKRESQPILEDIYSKRHKNNSNLATPIQTSTSDEQIEIVYAHNLKSSSEIPNEETSLFNRNILETLRSISNHHNQLRSTQATENEPNTYSYGNHVNYDNYSTLDASYKQDNTRQNYIQDNRYDVINNSNSFRNHSSYTNSTHDKPNYERGTGYNDRRSDHRSYQNSNGFNSRYESKKYEDSNRHQSNSGSSQSCHRDSNNNRSELSFVKSNIPNAPHLPNNGSDAFKSRPSTKGIIAETYRDIYNPEEKKGVVELEEVNLRQQSIFAGPKTYRERVKKGVETDPRRLEQRQKQIDLGKNTLGYAAYTKAVPRKERIHLDDRHPVTPSKHQECSKRSFDGQIKKWRKLLHRWDPVVAEDEIKVKAEDYVDLAEIDEEMAELERQMNEKEKNLEEFST